MAWRRITVLGSVLAGTSLGVPAADAGPPADPCKKSGEIVVIEWDAINAAAAQFGLTPFGEMLVEWLDTEDLCDGATNENTSFILVNGNAGKNWLTIASEGLGTHLRWAIDLNEESDWVYFRGTPGRDFFHFATTTNDQGEFQTMSYQKSRVPNGDLINVEWGGATSLGRPDVIGGGPHHAYAPSVAAAGGDTGPAKIQLLFKGGSGNDTIVGGTQADTLAGGGGDDDIDGEGGKDKIKGGGGEDDCNGGPGKDKVKSCE